jgi:methyltransferase (TIGR00027 family)
VYASTRLRSFDYLAAAVISGGSASFRARLGVFLLKLGAIGLTRRLISRTSPGADVFLFARQAVPDEMIREALRARPATQVVILGAGLDTSGLRIGAERRAAGLSPGTFFEVDLPAMQLEKRALAARLVRLEPDLDGAHIRYVPCSFGENELVAALRAAAFDPSQPTIWVWSGVIHYLNEAAVRGTVADLKRLSTAGSLLFFDFILLEAYERPVDYGFAQTKRRFDSYGEVMSFGFRQGTDDVRQWLAAQGVAFVRSYTSDDMVELFRHRTGQPAPSHGTPWSSLCVARF